MPNLSSVKETAKRTAAVTLLLSTVACTINDVDDGGIGNFILGFSCCWLATFIPFGLMMLKMHLDEGKIKEWNSWHQGGGDHLGPNH